MHKQLSCDIDKQIPFYDVDAYQIVWHGNYAKYFEEARCALLEQINCSYSEMQKWGYFFPIIDFNVRYIKPLLFKQKVRVNATLEEWQHKLVINYLITDLDSGEHLTKGSTTQAAVSMPDQITQYESPTQLLETINSLHSQ